MFELIKKNAIKKISKSKKRFFSIVIITLLGTGIFVGLKSSSFNMIETLDTYLDKTNTYDIKIISSLGLTEKDIATLKNLESINTVEGVYFKDVIADLGSKKVVIQLNSINKEINNIELIEGRFPKQEDEILVEPALIKQNKEIKIGDYIKVNDDSLKISKFKIVGTIKSPQYIGPETYSGSRGLTTIGNGYINYYTYVLEETVKTEYYPVIYLTVKDSKNKVTNSNEYEKLIKNAIAEIETIKDENQRIRYNDIFNSANEKINSKIAEGEKELEEYKKQLDDADKQLKEGNNELESSKALLKKHTEELENAKKTIEETAKILENKKIELQNYKSQLDEAEVIISEKNTQLDNANSMLNQTKEKLDKANDELIKAKTLLDENRALLDEKKEELDLARTYLDNSKEELNSKLKPYNFSYEKVKNIKDYIDISSDRKEKIISYIPKNILHYDRVIEFINKIYDTTSNDIFEYIHRYSDIIDALIEGIPTQWKSHDLIVSLLTAMKGRIDDFCLINSVVNSIVAGENEYKNYLEQYNAAEELYNSKIEEYNKQKALYDESLEKYENSYNLYLLGKNELDNKKEEYRNAYNLYEQWLEELEKSIKQYENAYEQLLASQNEIKNGKIKWDESYKIYQSKLEEYNTNLEKYNNIKEEFESEVKKAKTELDKIPESIWYIYERNDDSNYNSFLDAYNSVINLAKIFPILFYALAIFVCGINTSRMVDEDRREIGIFKALGTEKKYIKANYLFYSLIATIIGGIIGSILGFYLLPLFIWNAYSVAFDIPNYEIAYNFNYIISGIGISVLLLEITTYLAARKVLNESIVSLKRSKLPKDGKKVLFEKIPVISKCLSFKNKLIIRNIFIYKKKIFMTIISTVGAILLLLTGFSIKYSITTIVDLQYGKLNSSDLLVYINNNTSNDRISEILNDTRIKSYQKMNISTVNTKEFYEVYLQAVDEPYCNEVNYYDVNTGKKLEFLDNEVIISSKLAILLNKNISDTIEIVLQDNSKKILKISGIFENYWNHIIAMNKNTFEKEFSEYNTNSIYITLNDKQEEENLIKNLKQQEEIQNVISIKDVKQQVDNTLEPLNKIVMLLIILSGSLTVVILYNLAIINISERKKEISTLKVLGFKNRELDYYIITETIILTIIGIIIGLFIGKSVSMFIVKGLEIEKARYVYKMMPQTYLYSTLLMVLFIGITNVLTHFGLKKIKLNEKL